MDRNKIPILASHKTCSGCMACGEVCPKNCISFIMGNDGFWYPQIDGEICIHCHTCERVCPITKPIAQKEKRIPKSYAAWMEKENRHNSASGGVFYALGETVIKNGGYVSGAIFDGCRVKHIVTNKLDELIKIQGTKYFQSDVSGVYKEIKHLLHNGEMVLFGGTSCQVAGLLNVVGDKNENLVTVDLICYGVPSSLIIGVEERIRGKKLKQIFSSRDKNHSGGWRNSYYMSCEWDDGTITTSPQKESFMLESFCSGKVMRNSCYHCPYKTIYRLSDFTIGDYHCVQGYDEQKQEGISLVYVNTEIGLQTLLESKNLTTHERDIRESLSFKRTIYYNDTIYSKRLTRRWMPFLLKHLPYYLLIPMYQVIAKSKNPIFWPLTAIDVMYYLINNHKAKKNLKTINI